MDAFERVVISAAGLTLAPVEIHITASASEAARTFTARLAPVDASRAAIASFIASVPSISGKLAEGPPCTITATGDTIFTGWVERCRTKLSSTSPEIMIEGRSKSAVLIDASAIHPTGEWKDRNPADIVSDLAKVHGIGFVDKSKEMTARSLFRITQGESVVSAAWRLARVDGHLLTSSAEGDLVYYRGTLGTHAGGLVEGVNLGEDAESVFDWSKRAKTTKVKGQRASGWKADDLEIDEEEEDDTVQRPVVRVVVASEEIDAGLAKKRAKWRRDQAAGEGLKVTVPNTIGWRDEAGALWSPAFLVPVDSPYLGVSESLAIEKAEFVQSDTGGTHASLELVDPRALGGKKSKGGKSKKHWKMPK